MKISRYIFACTCLIALSSIEPVFAQPGYKVDVKKPKPYEERVLRAEKTGEGKLKQPKRFFQNLTTHFNYFFNANTKLNEILDRAKAAHKDDYSQLLSFYNYSTEHTRADSIQLDSIIYKSQTGILMHDLRSDWADDLYLLWGAAYYLWDKLDSASLMFQFINHAFAEKEEDGYYIPVGTHREGQQTLSIASIEKSGLFGKTTSRNNAFIWQIRTLTDLGQYAQAAGLINTLKNDPLFPERLHHALEEVQAYWFYRQQQWDSSASHLVLAAEGAGSRLEKARWEYLAAQMFELAGQPEKAKELYARSIPHTTDPVMEVYARLNLVKLNKGNGDNFIEQNIAELLRMAKKDKYEDYRDIIYYMAAQMEMERNNLDAAQALLIKGSKYNNGNLAARNKAFLQIGDIFFNQRKYQQAASFYDSLQLYVLPQADQGRISQRKPLLAKIVWNEKVVERQDSLQKIAAMPEEERNALLAKMVKQLRREQGLKEEPVNFGRGNVAAQNPADFFTSTQAKGEWYFYNTTLKTQGQQQFRQIWGNRPNADNWRRSSNLNQQLVAQNNAAPSTASAQDVAETAAPTVEGLAEKLPTTAEKLTLSNDSIKTALNALGNIFFNELEDYLSAIDAWEALRERFPDFTRMDEVLYNLYYAYLRSGDLAKAEQIKNLLLRQHPTSGFATMARTGKNPAANNSMSPEATRDYEAVYNLFIEGNFDQAIAAKRRADSVYQTNYWQPQLLYIEAVYYIQQRQDSTAKNILQVLAAQEAGNNMGEKAQNLMNVLARRAQIEKELSEYQIQNQPEPPVRTQPVVQAPVTQPPAVVQTKPAEPLQPKPEKKDSIAAPLQTQTAVEKPKDTVAVAKTQPPATPVEEVKKDTVVTKPQVQNEVTQKPPADANPQKPPVIETPKPPADANSYFYDAAARHYAVIVLDKVDPIFVSEARNAFLRFTREKFSNLPLQAEINDITRETRLVLVGEFASADAAIDFVKTAKQLAQSEIVPWLKADKYSFSIITARNLQLLKQKGNWSEYRKFTEQHLQGKF